jgi:hypothetical protein
MSYENENTSVRDEDLPEADLASLLAVNDSKEEWLYLKEWGFKIKIRSLSKADQIMCRKRATRQGRLDDDAFEGHLLLSGIVSPRLSAEHLDRLQSKNVGVITKITRRILELSSMSSPTRKRQRPTFETNPDLFQLFYTAEQLGKTVDEILTGESRPMSTTEFRYWAAYFVFKNKLQQESHDKMMEESQEPEKETYMTMGRSH